MDTISALSPAERMYAVFAAYGKAMMLAHSLERHLAALLEAYSASEPNWKLANGSSVNRIQKLTMGQLISLFADAYKPTEHLLEELDNMLFFRNELAHRIVDTVVLATMSQEWEGKLISELTDWAEMFRETSKLLQPYSDAWFEARGIKHDEMMKRLFIIHPGIKHEA